MLKGCFICSSLLPEQPRTEVLEARRSEPEGLSLRRGRCEEELQDVSIEAAPPVDEQKTEPKNYHKY